MICQNWHRTIFVILVFGLAVFATHPLNIGHGRLFATPSSVGGYEGAGLAAPLYWTGDGNRLNDSSFETGSYQPWVPVQSNAFNGNVPQIAPIGYDGVSSVRLNLSSGNFSNNNFWDPGEPVVYDNKTGIANGIYDSGETIIKGPVPPGKSLLQNDPFVKFVDTNGNNRWSPGEAVILDVIDNNIYDTSYDEVISGTAPSAGAVLRQDPKITFVDQNNDSYHSLLYDLTRSPTGFESSLRFRAAILLEDVTGPTLSDRVEVTISLLTSQGNTLAIHYFVTPNPDGPSNTTSDAYYRISNSLGLWVALDRNVFQDAQQAFSSVFPSINSVREVRLSVFARTQPGPADDPKIKYVDTNINNFWDAGEAIAYDQNNDSLYEQGEQIISGFAPTNGTSLKDDPKILFVDSNNNNVWDTGSPGESVIYDKNSNAQYDPYVNGEMVIYGATPDQGTLLQKPVHEATRSLFDRVELYSANGNYDWVRNGGFTSGLSAWTTIGFTTSPSVFNQTAPSASGTISNGAIELDQSIDGRPTIEPWVNFKAAVRVGTMTGSSRNDTVDILLGMVDSRGYAFSLYYMFRTGDLVVPTNATDAIYVRADGFGSLNQWISVNRNLNLDTQDFGSLLGFVRPFRIEVIALEVAASGASASTAFFDDISIYQPYKYGQATSYFYSAVAENSTYVYTASNIAQGTFYLDIPRGQSVLNVTAPDRVAIINREYSVQVDVLAGIRRITVSGTSMFAHPPLGEWTVFTTATNSLTKLYAEDPIKKTENSTLNIGSAMNLVSRSIDPLGMPIYAANVTITVWNNATGATLLTKTGITISRGFFNVTDINPPPGTYIMQATSFSKYVGIAKFAFSLKYVLALSLNVSTSQIPAGRSVTISGSVTPPAAGIVVTIYYRLAGNSQKTELATVTTDSTGRYSYTWSPPEGDYEVSASIGDQSTTSVQSNPAVVLVGPPENTLVLLLAIIGVIAAAAVAALVFLRLKSRRLQPPSGRTA